MLTATDATWTEIDLRIADIGRLDPELGRAYQELFEQLDFAGELDERRASVMVTGLAAMLDVLNADRVCRYCVTRMSPGDGEVCELCDAHGATLTTPPTG